MGHESWMCPSLLALKIIFHLVVMTILAIVLCCSIYWEKIKEEQKDRKQKDFLQKEAMYIYSLQDKTRKEKRQKKGCYNNLTTFITT